MNNAYDRWRLQGHEPKEDPFYDVMVDYIDHNSEEMINGIDDVLNYRASDEMPITEILKQVMIASNQGADACIINIPKGFDRHIDALLEEIYDIEKGE